MQYEIDDWVIPTNIILIEHWTFNINNAGEDIKILKCPFKIVNLFDNYSKNIEFGWRGEWCTIKDVHGDTWVAPACTIEFYESVSNLIGYLNEI